MLTLNLFAVTNLVRIQYCLSLA